MCHYSSEAAEEATFKVFKVATTISMQLKDHAAYITYVTIIT